MAYTADDLTRVEAAIVTLQTGSRTVQVMVNSKMIRYSESKLSDLMALRSTIMLELGMIQRRTYARQAGRGN